MLSHKVVSALLFFSSSISTAQQPVLLKAHSHNDYKHKHPLQDALENGFFSVEVDLFYENGLFVVAHTRAGIRKKNTLEKLYLLPIKERIKLNGGKIYANGPLEFEMMIDLKGDWTREQLDSMSSLIGRYPGFFTRFIDGVKTEGSLRIVLSGNRAKYHVAHDNPRFFSIDGSFDDFDSALDSNVICRISASFRKVFQWRGRGNMPENERKMLQEYVAKAHTSGRKIRFWAATNKKKVWKEMLDAGVDWINIDKLMRFKQFYTSYSN